MVRKQILGKSINEVFSLCNLCMDRHCNECIDKSNFTYSVFGLRVELEPVEITYPTLRSNQERT
jgi:hypothetical protein